MNKVFNIVIFLAGAGVGSTVTWFLTKKKYSDIAQKEIDSVKEAFSNKKKVFKERNNDAGSNISNDIDKATKKAGDALRKSSITNYANILNMKSYAKMDEEDKKLGKECPYVISPDEFGELDDYEKVSLTYYKDGVLTDDNDDIIDDVDAVVGLESLDHFGEYEDDSVFVRNDQRMCDYEILLDLRTYSEAMRDEKPYLHRDEDEDGDGE